MLQASICLSISSLENNFNFVKMKMKNLQGRVFMNIPTFTGDPLHHAQGPSASFSVPGFLPSPDLLDFAWASLLLASIASFCLCILLINIIFFTSSNLPVLDFSNVIISLLAGTALRFFPQEPRREVPCLVPIMISNPLPTTFQSHPHLPFYH